MHPDPKPFLHQLVSSRFEGTPAPVWPEGLRRHAARLSAARIHADPAAAKAAVSVYTPQALTGKPEMAGDIAVLRVSGLVVQSPSVWEAYGYETSTDRLSELLAQALADDSVRGVVFAINSPGGEVYGTPELAAQILAAREKKPVVALVAGVAASAAYWIASCCREIVMTRSSEAGSIGVYCVHFDQSGMLAQIGVVPTEITAGDYKAEFSPLKPLSEEARAQLQKSVDETYAWFVSDVAKGRGTTPAAVRKDFGQGRMFSAKEAVSLGMADREGTFADALGRAAKLRVPSAGSAATRARAVRLAEAVLPRRIP